jgi:hypothetical protein
VILNRRCTYVLEVLFTQQKFLFIVSNADHFYGFFKDLVCPDSLSPGNIQILMLILYNEFHVAVIIKLNHLRAEAENLLVDHLGQPLDFLTESQLFLQARSDAQIEVVYHFA